MASPENLKNAALFPRLGLPSTLINPTKRSFSKTLLQLEAFENVMFSFQCVDRKYFENEAFK